MTDTTTTPGRTGRDAYYEAAGSWADDRNAGLRRSRRVAWIAAGTLALLALCEALAMMLMTPLKTVVPYTVLVDRHTGFVTAIDPLASARVSGDTALTQSFLVQYVTAREGYDAATMRSDYNKVGLWSAGPARSGYIAAMQASNPDSPIARFARSAGVAASVKSVSPVNATTAMVRFDTEIRLPGGGVRPHGSWVAMIRYRFVGAPMRVEDRFLNPLGFQVTSYHRNPEVLAVPAVAGEGDDGDVGMTTQNGSDDAS